MAINRREFLKQSIAAAIGLSLPITLSADLVIVEIKALDSIRDIIRVGAPFLENGQAFMPVTIKGNIFDHIRLVDEEGREWSTNDEGQNWYCGLMSFSMEGRYEPA